MLYNNAYLSIKIYMRYYFFEDDDGFDPFRYDDITIKRLSTVAYACLARGIRDN